MSFHRIHESSSKKTQTSQNTSQFAPRPFPIEQTQQESGMPPTQEEIENEAFEQDQFEARRLQLKEKYGAIAPAEQERLGVLQAKMDSFWVQRRERTKGQPNLLEILTRKGRATPATAPVQPIQPKLAIGQPNDQYEQEADRVAEQVISMAPPAASKVQRQTEEEEQAEIQTKPLAEAITPMVQRLEASEDEELVQTKCEGCEGEEQIQRSPDNVAQSQPHLESRLNNSKSGGSPLSDEVRSFMEPRFGFNFSQVRVHNDSEAVQMNRELNAQAFTHGSHIYFGEGKSPANDNLTAHEMTHVLQQTGGEQLQAKWFNLETHPITIANSQDGWVQRYPDTILEVAQMGFAETILRLSIDQVIKKTKDKKELINEAFWTAYPQMKGKKINDENVPDPEQKQTYIDAYLYIQKTLYPKVEKESRKSAKDIGHGDNTSESENASYPEDESYWESQNPSESSEEQLGSGWDDNSASSESEASMYGPWQDPELYETGEYQNIESEQTDANSEGINEDLDSSLQSSLSLRDARNLADSVLESSIEKLHIYLENQNSSSAEYLIARENLKILELEAYWRIKGYYYEPFARVFQDPIALEEAQKLPPDYATDLIERLESYLNDVEDIQIESEDEYIAMLRSNWNTLKQVFMPEVKTDEDKKDEQKEIDPNLKIKINKELAAVEGFLFYVGGVYDKRKDALLNLESNLEDTHDVNLGFTPEVKMALDLAHAAINGVLSDLLGKITIGASSIAGNSAIEGIIGILNQNNIDAAVEKARSNLRTDLAAFIKLQRDVISDEASLKLEEFIEQKEKFYTPDGLVQAEALKNTLIKQNRDIYQEKQYFYSAAAWTKVIGKIATSGENPAGVLRLDVSIPYDDPTAKMKIKDAVLPDIPPTVFEKMKASRETIGKATTAGMTVMVVIEDSEPRREIVMMSGGDNALTRNYTGHEAMWLKDRGKQLYEMDTTDPSVLPSVAAVFMAREIYSIPLNELPK